jgi:arylsulfatase A-like enzyme
MVATVALWLPLTALPILDGMWFVSSTMDVARDVGLLLWLGLLPASMLVVATLLVHRFVAWRWAQQADWMAWSLLLIPLLLLVVRQSGRVGLEWLRSFAPESIQLAPSTKLALLALTVVVAVLLMWRTGWRHALNALIRFLAALRGLAVALLVMGAIAIALNPPDWQPMQSGTSPAAAPQAHARPNILLLTIDTLAAEDADACNPASSNMPRLAAFAQGAFCFKRFQTAGNFTTASVSTMESGLLPWIHLANQPDATMHVGTRTHTLAHQLRQAGWRTHSITDNLLGSPRHRGSHRGYDTAWLSRTGLLVNAPRYAATRFPGTSLPRLVAASLAFLAPIDARRVQHDSPYRSDDVYDDLARLLAQEGESNRPSFVMTLSLPPHAPYLPPANTKYKLLPKGELDTLVDLMPDNIAYPASAQPLVDKHRLRYRESVMAADESLGQVLDRLERDGHLKNTIVVITTDHGESFGHLFLGHAGPHLHQALVHGPLVIRLPGQSKGRVIEQWVSQADLAPTLLDLVNEIPLPRPEGRSLRPLLEGRDTPSVPVFSMAMEHQHRNAPFRRGQVAVIDGPWKLILRLEDKSAKLFNLDADPGELQDVATEHSAVRARLQALIEERLASAAAWHQR